MIITLAQRLHYSALHSIKNALWGFTIKDIEDQMIFTIIFNILIKEISRP